jgi:hypothetical protein
MIKLSGRNSFCRISVVGYDNLNYMCVEGLNEKKR